MHRRLAAVLGIDIMGYSILMQMAEEETHHRVGEAILHVRQEIESHHGREFSFSGDGLMAEFPSAVEALKCALRIQADAGRRNEEHDADKHILFRIGINVGEIVVEGLRAGGTTVNIAARLEGIAEPGGIALAEAVWLQVRDVVPATYRLYGRTALRNIRDPVTIYRIPVLECSSWLGMPSLTRSRSSGDIRQEYRPSLAILPLRTLQPEQADAYFSEGIVDDIIFGLASIKDLVVVSRSSTQVFANAPLDLRQIGHDLDVRYVLHGSVRSGGGRLRISVELAEAGTGSVIWIERFDGDMADLFDLQDRIAIRVATSVAPHLRERELARALRKHPESMTAYDLVLQATDLFHKADWPSLQRANTLLERAIASDPDYGPAYSHRAAIHMRAVAQRWSSNPDADAQKAAEYAQEAIRREPNDPVALAIYGHVQSFLYKKFREARHYLDSALDAGSSNALAWGYSSLTRGYTGDCTKAVDEAEHALRLSPVGIETPRFEHYLATALYLAGRYAEAVDWGRTSHARFPTNVSNVICLIASHVAVNKLEVARSYAQHLLQLIPTFTISAFCSRTPLSPETCLLVADRLRHAGIPD